jgi:UDP-N-acetylmuramoylalanine--D-glutamate ligase
MMIASADKTNRAALGQQLRAGGMCCVVAGLGRSGVSAARYLSRHGHHVRITDSREDPPGLAELADDRALFDLSLGGLDEDALGGADMLVLSPGLSAQEPIVAAARKRGVPVVGDVELFARVATSAVIAVTGSNGKSTVCSMLAEMLPAAGIRIRAGGNLGTPALDLLGDGEPDAYVLELSSFQLDLTASLRPRVAALLNISADHLDRHGDMDAYVAAKAKIFNGCDVAVYNRDDPAVEALRPQTGATVSFGLDEPGPGQYGLHRVDGEVWLARGDEPLLRASALAVQGLPNVANALAALAIADALGAPVAPMLGALCGFAGLPHRMQVVARHRDVTYINDSKATNVGAAVAAIAGLDSPFVLIAGGDAKGADFAPLAEALAGRAIAVVLIGRDSRRIGAALEGVCQVEYAADMHSAVAIAARLAPAGASVLLAPSCASLDMYRNFAERGDDFAAAVGALDA